MIKKRIDTLSLIAMSLTLSISAHAGNDIERIMNQTNSSIKTSKAGDKIATKGTDKEVYNYQEVVYERILDNENNSVSMSDGKANKKFAYSNVKDEKNRLSALAENARKDIQASKDKNKEKESFDFASGYCYVDNEITVERIATYAYLQCDFKEPVGHATLVMSIVPDFYAKALVGTPLYVEKGSRRYPVASGAILTKNKNSINIANLINDRKVEKITTMGIYNSTTIAAKTAQSYLAMKQRAAVSSDMNTIATSGGTTTVSSTNTQEVELGNYLVAGTIELISSLSKVIGEAVINDLPYTFKIYKDSVLFADVQLSNKDKIIGFKTEKKDEGMVMKEPRFSIDGAEEEVEPTQVLQREEK